MALIPSCSLTDCERDYVHGHGTDTLYGPVERQQPPQTPTLDSGRQQPACGNLKVHRPHNGMAVDRPALDPWCHGVGVPDFVEDHDSVRGPGWGVRHCPYCDHVTFGGTEVVTEEEIVEHIDERCPEVVPQAPAPGGFDAALYAAFWAGVKARHQAGLAMKMMNAPEEFRRWRAQWHGEWTS